MTLTGKRILLTRFEEEDPTLLNGIVKEGGVPILCPLLKIAYREIQMNCSNYTWIFFTSQHGVHSFFKDNKIDRQIKIAVVGEKTKKVVESYGYGVDFIPSHYRAQTFVEEISSYLTKEDKILFVKGNLARETISQLGMKCSLDEKIAYDTILDEKGIYLFQEWIQKGDAVVFTSPSAVNAIKEIRINIPIFVIGPTTKEAAMNCGYKEVYMPSIYTISELIQEIKRRL